MNDVTRRLFGHSGVIAALMLVLTLALAGCGQAQQAADGGEQAPAEEAAEQAEATDEAQEAEATEDGEEEYEYFSSWAEGAPAIEALKEYVEDVTNPDSPNYIKPEERIVVSDLDGTLYCETNPTYFDWALSVHRVLYDTNFEPTPELVDMALEIEETERTGVYQSDGMWKQAHMAAEAYEGMTPDELWDYSIAFGEQPAPHFTGMNRDESFYVPMLEIIEYLQDNDFIFYVVTGSDRTVTRALVDGMIDIPPRQVIGSDNSLVATGQGDTDGLDYTYDGLGGDELVFGGEFGIKDLKMNKVTAISREIGVQPIMALGNSTSDSAMLAYVVNGNPNRAMALFVLADDTEREFGNPDKAVELRKLCEEQGWEAISMRDDWKTIYGPDVEVDADWTWDSPDKTGANARETSYADQLVELDEAA